MHMNEREVTDLVAEEPLHSPMLSREQRWVLLCFVFFLEGGAQGGQEDIPGEAVSSFSVSCLVLAPQVQGVWGRMVHGNPQWEEKVPLADP